MMTPVGAASPAVIEDEFKSVRTFSLPSGRQLLIAQDTSNGADGGAVVWDAAWPLVDWLMRSGALQGCTSAIELGSGTGVVAIAARLAGVPHVVATDHRQALCDLCLSNGRLNGVTLTAVRHAWGADNVDEVVAACEDDALTAASPSHAADADAAVAGRIILLSDLYYHNDHTPGPGNALERSVRALIARGGCRMVAASWKERTLREESFLGRMRDLGRVLPTVRFANGVCVGALQVGSRE